MSSGVPRGRVTSAVLIVALSGPAAVLRADDDSATTQCQALHQRASQCYEQGTYQEATELLEKVVGLALKEFGPDHPAAASIASVWSEPVAVRDLHPLKIRAFSRRTMSAFRIQGDS